MDRYLDTYRLLDKWSQTGLLNFYDALDDAERTSLCKQIAQIDFALIDKLYHDTIRFDALQAAIKRDIKPVKSVMEEQMDQALKEEYYRTGIALIEKGAVAAVTMAGGQGTRLGHNGPKGTFDIGLASHRSLFALQCDRLKEIAKESGFTVPWYIMTGNDNHDQTVAYFKDNDYLGYDPDSICFFMQGMLPIVHTDGKILLKTKSEVYMGPDGNGGLFKAAKTAGVIADMRRRGVQWVFICGVDNAAVKMADPLLVGLTKRAGYKAASKSVAKRDPEENAGVFCYAGGKPSVIEYFELPDEYRYLKDESGELVYNDANIIGHLFDIDLFEKISEQGLPYHTAFKRIPTIDGNGNRVEPDQNNAYKYETFIFDAFSFCDDMLVLRVPRSEFAPVKRKEGVDSPQTAREILRENGEY